MNEITTGSTNATQVRFAHHAATPPGGDARTFHVVLLTLPAALLMTAEYCRASFFIGVEKDHGVIQFDCGTLGRWASSGLSTIAGTDAFSPFRSIRVMSRSQDRPRCP